MDGLVILTHDMPHCPACGATGEMTYTHLIDTLYDVSGEWSFRQCTNQACGTYWLDPAPEVTSLASLYTAYTTHIDPPSVQQTKRTPLKRLLDAIRTSVLAREYRYESTLPLWQQVVLDSIARIHPGWRDAQCNQVLYVPFVQNGRLLDVGCGGGEAMLRLQQRGWHVEGTDFDEKAVLNARQKGLTVHLGDLPALALEAGSFDAILLSHVIEHVPDPLSLLRECYRLLRPGGCLVALTPNAASRGHQKFKEHWRGLEVPRHLQVFTPQALQRLGEDVGFAMVRGTTCMQGVFYIWDASEQHACTGSFSLATPTRWSKILAHIRLFTAGLRFALLRGSEETALLVCRK